jgi:hypothetical protein
MPGEAEPLGKHSAQATGTGPDIEEAITTLTPKVMMMLRSNRGRLVPVRLPGDMHGSDVSVV